jgi:hypothetical protein
MQRIGLGIIKRQFSTLKTKFRITISMDDASNKDMIELKR